jgi:hypothetical protein
VCLACAALRLCPFLTYVADCQPGVRILRCCIAFAVPRVRLSLPLRVSLFPDRLLSVPHPRPSPLITTLLILALSHPRHSFSVLDFLNSLKILQLTVELGERKRRKKRQKRSSRK